MYRCECLHRLLFIKQLSITLSVRIKEAAKKVPPLVVRPLRKVNSRHVGHTKCKVKCLTSPIFFNFCRQPHMAIKR